VQLPLMPLNTVLFPGMPMPLAIFEQRYLRMVEECRCRDIPFGVALLRNGPEVGGIGEPHSVGTSALIVETTDTDDGLHIVVVGRERFRIRALEVDDDLLRAEVALIPASRQTAHVSQELLQELSHMLQRHVRTILELLGLPAVEVALPPDPERLSFMIAAHLTAGLAVRQGLLEIDDPGERLVQVRELLREESSQYELLLAASRRAAEAGGDEGAARGGFSRN